ncbi:MAG TPA: N-acetyltransferase [Candidatus Hydrogenedentes bacterium]|nr:MAG: Amino-acid acetyltransferase [Candidatus Hydrogenedentes bacterium ADurb.Bin170]HNZ48448.1 N-acetyltransferase [Candidatus Hydrogenedentota bacterium]HOD94415.1 N-acetyltransferase [Candidatus Hydrogenedentota bacterium]HOM47626.1 N-acetyltransferase [Candidatus Hydrogenedentota bacterium]HOR51881.1 N-acetyltransferase [Candidatus Hydrogenedentota bacterium]
MGIVRKPKLTEIADMKALLDEAAAARQVLPRELSEMLENARDFFVYVDEEGVGGMAALHIDLVDLAEVRSLVVRDRLRGRGIGSMLVEATVEEARQLQIARVYAFTRQPEFFKRLGFEVVDRAELPYKALKDCQRCPFFAQCDETALVRPVPPAEMTGVA